MSYQVLARKWRPKSFQQLMGQEHVVTVLTNALEQQRLHHAYLFTGTRGVGKTTIARIFAKSLNCDTGITATPCGQCDTCKDIDLGRFVDLLEIDAASRTKVDDTREILDNVQYAPTRGRYKVYLIDEVHMLSRSSFNALLKTLEEPPEHVKFILATTDPQKLPVTVLSRCLQFHLKALSVKQIEQQLQIILTAEQVEVENSALTLLAKAARGSMRDSLSLTDQAIAQGKGVISTANVQQMLGGVDNNWVFKLLISLLKQDGKQMMALSLEIASYAPNYGRLMADFIQLLHQIAMAQVIGNHFDLSTEHQQLFEKFCQAMSPEDVQLYYQIVLSGRKDLPYAADEQAAFDMTLLRLLAFKPQQMPENTQLTQKTIALVDFDVGELDDTNLHRQTADTGIKTVQPAQAVAVNDKSASILHSGTASKELLPTDNEPAISQAVIEQQLAAQMLSIEQSASEQILAQPVSQLSTAEQGPTAEQSPIEDAQYEDQLSSSDIQQPSALLNTNDDSLSVNTVNRPATETSADETDRPNNQIHRSSTEIETVIANRNMLRSRKKALEDNGKKLSDATSRQATTVQNTELLTEKPSHVPAIESISEQPFSVDVINPAEIKLANQVDKWANMIDNMALQGRLRQLAIHATIGENSTENLLILKLDQATKHLKTEAAHHQLEQHLSQLLDKPITVELELVELSKDDPFQIQSHIDDKRYDYAKQLIEKDEWVIAMQNQFQAIIDDKTIQAR
jgi:DNA polymerase-3 subunit gamma/tau